MHDKKDLSDIPQLWAIYKEVMGYFASGVRDILHFCTLGVQLICSSKCRKKVSHLEWRHHGRNTSANTDQIVTALLADDNWGNLQAVMPTDRDHAGGGGIYYHADCESCYPLSVTSLSRHSELINRCRRPQRLQMDQYGLPRQE